MSARLAAFGVFPVLHRMCASLRGRNVQVVLNRTLKLQARVTRAEVSNGN